MKKIALATIIISFSMSLVGCNNAGILPNGNTIPNNQGINGNGENTNNKITVEQAKEIALKHANLTSDQVTFVKTEMDFDNGIKKYDIEFYSGTKEYDYEINANTGEIISYDYDAEYNNQQGAANNGVAKISVEQAKEIALKHANLTSDQVRFGRVEMDYDHGVLKYDVEFYKDFREYSYEIDANTGNIVGYEQD